MIEKRKHKKRIVKQVRNELFECRKRMNKLIFTKKGDYKRSIDRRDKRFVLRAYFILGRIMNDSANGAYKSSMEHEKRGK